jgi:hypothetical protein
MSGNLIRQALYRWAGISDFLLYLEHKVATAYRRFEFNENLQLGLEEICD